MDLFTRDQMAQYFLSDPINKPCIRTIQQVKIEYKYFTQPLTISTAENEVCNLCLLKGNSTLTRKKKKFPIKQFDLIFLPKNEKIRVTPSIPDELTTKICIVKSPVLGDIKTGEVDFELQHYSNEKFIPRGELGDTEKMATYREVWTAIKNGYFMSGFTNIPQKALAQGVVTSVNLEKDEGTTKVLSHVHPDYPEIYIYCIDDPKGSVAVTQYLINAQGQSISMDLVDGEGVFFDGSLGHINFTKPTYKKLNYCQYMWIIPTFGKTKNVVPVTLRI